LALTTTKKISLDFYNNNYITVNAKQLDTESRYINITCTDYGKKVTLSADTMSVFVRYKKSDGKFAFNDAEILEDGTIDVELTQQMLAVDGKQTVDIIIVAESGLNVESLNDAENIYDLGVTIVSTMTFYVNVEPTAIEHSCVTSVDEFDALLKALARLGATEDTMRTLKSELEISKSDTEAATADAKDALEKAEEAERAAGVAQEKAEAAYNSIDEYVTKAEKAVADADVVVKNCNEIIDKGIVLQSEKGVENGVATLDENGQITESQVETLCNNIALDFENMGNLMEDIGQRVDDIENILERLPEIHYGTSAPSNSLGKNGDIYMQIIE